jgi:hypothetical protein
MSISKKGSLLDPKLQNFAVEFLQRHAIWVKILV